MTRRTPSPARITRRRHAIQHAIRTSRSPRPHRAPSPIGLGFTCFRLIPTCADVPASQFAVVRLVKTSATMGSFVGRL